MFDHLFPHARSCSPSSPATGSKEYPQSGATLRAPYSCGRYACVSLKPDTAKPRFHPNYRKTKWRSKDLPRSSKRSATIHASQMKQQFRYRTEVLLTDHENPNATHGERASRPFVEGGPCLRGSSL